MRVVKTPHLGIEDDEFERDGRILEAAQIALAFVLAPE